MDSHRDLMPANDEDELLHAAVLGDVDALEQLLAAHGPAVRRSLAGKIDARWQSLLTEDDVLQETYLEAFASIGRFEPRGIRAFVSWLTTMARRNLIDAIRELSALKQGGGQTRIPNQTAGPDDSCLALVEQLGGSTTSPSGNAARDEAKTLLHAAVEQLPGPYQLVVELYDLEQRRAEDVAQNCECGVGAVYMRRARAHAMLRQLLSEDPLHSSRREPCVAHNVNRRCQSTSNCRLTSCSVLPAGGYLCMSSGRR